MLGGIGMMGALSRLARARRREPEAGFVMTT
jgi:hypothetical protein